jgi:elongation factor Tu
MSTDPSFRMTVNDVFFIRGRGVVVTGQIESGTLQAGDEVYLKGEKSTRKVKVTGIESFRKQLTQAQAGENVGILLGNITKDDIKQGDVLSGSDPEFSWKV